MLLKQIGYNCLLRYLIEFPSGVFRAKMPLGRLPGHQGREVTSLCVPRTEAIYGKYGCPEQLAWITTLFCFASIRFRPIADYDTLTVGRSARDLLARRSHLSRMEQKKKGLCPAHSVARCLHDGDDGGWLWFFGRSIEYNYKITATVA